MGGLHRQGNHQHLPVLSDRPHRRALVLSPAGWRQHELPPQMLFLHPPVRGLHTTLKHCETVTKRANPVQPVHSSTDTSHLVVRSRNCCPLSSVVALLDGFTSSVMVGAVRGAPTWWPGAMAQTSGITTSGAPIVPAGELPRHALNHGDQGVCLLLARVLPDPPSHRCLAVLGQCWELGIVQAGRPTLLLDLV